MRVALFVALYWVGAALAMSFVERPDQVTLIWPSSALSFCFVVMFGLRWLPSTPLALLLVHLTLAPVPPLFLGISLIANTLGCALGAGYVRRFAPEATSVLAVRSGVSLLQGGALQSMVSAVLGCAGMVAAGMVDPGHYAGAVAKWAMADLFGMIALTPAILILAQWRRIEELRVLSVGFGGRREKLAWIAAMLAATGLFVGAGGASAAYALGLSSVPLAALLWAALRFEPAWSAVATAAFALFATSIVGHGIGGFAPPASLPDTLILLGFMSLFAMVPLMVAGATHQSRIAAQRLIRRANTDPLTRLANRTAFEERTRDLAQTARGEPMALAYVDLDHFKLVNDQLTHAAGDRLIVALAGVLRTTLRQGELLARTGGDEFALLLRRCPEEEARQRAQALHDAIASFRFSEGEQVVTASASIGVVPFVAGGQEFPRLLAQADAACFTAKELGGNRVQVAHAGDGEVRAQTEAMRSATAVKQAIAADRLVLFAQRIEPLGATAETALHFEVLVRMRPESAGDLLLPGSFVPAAERFKLGEHLDRHVIGRLLDWFDAEPAAAALVGTCSVNLTAASVQSEGFTGFLQRRLARSRLTPRQLCLELTETSAVRDLARAQRFIRSMRELGCRISLDDFGTGFCSFAYLKSLDADHFKVDGSFVRDVGASPESLAIVRAIADIARVMQRRTIAEGVESEAIRERLVALGVDYAQGYAIHRPAPLAEVLATARVVHPRTAASA